MTSSYFFYDLETTGLSHSEDRILQFAGQRTDASLQPIGDPVNLLIKIAPDIVPDPRAILLTGITPQAVLKDGLSEADFLSIFFDTIVQPETIFIGYNSVRFDDNFMRYLLYRNFYDAYAWQYQDGCSRWDMIDVVRMTRALRPDGIVWPDTAEGKPSNRLEAMTAANGLTHSQAHDALSDVNATIAVARLIMDKQPALFSFLKSIRSKKEVKPIICSGKPFTYTSGRLPSDYFHTTVVKTLGISKRGDSAYVYNLRVDPTPYLAMSVDQLVDHWRYNSDPRAVRLPIKTLRINHCPAVAPGAPADHVTLERLMLSRSEIIHNAALLRADTSGFSSRVLQAAQSMDAVQEQATANNVTNLQTVDSLLYDGFYDAADTKLLPKIRNAPAGQLHTFVEQFKDPRLQQLVLLYTARNYPDALTNEQRRNWEDYRAKRLLDGDQNSKLATYFNKLTELAANRDLSDQQAFILEELQLYGESIVPADPSDLQAAVDE
jgi:exodeoxyribonuclease-1